MLYTWSDVYSQQLQSGEKYHELNPTYSIWLLGENAIKNDDQYIHRYKFRDEAGVPLIEHGGIWLFELEKFNAQEYFSRILFTISSTVVPICCAID